MKVERGEWKGRNALIFFLEGKASEGRGLRMHRFFPQGPPVLYGSSQEGFQSGPIRGGDEGIFMNLPVKAGRIHQLKVAIMFPTVGCSFVGRAPQKIASGIAAKKDMGTVGLLTDLFSGSIRAGEAKNRPGTRHGETMRCGESHAKGRIGPRPQTHGKEIHIRPFKGDRLSKCFKTSDHSPLIIPPGGLVGFG